MSGLAKLAAGPWFNTKWQIAPPKSWHRRGCILRQHQFGLVVPGEWFRTLRKRNAGTKNRRPGLKRSSGECCAIDAMQCRQDPGDFFGR